jgi:hypothetical protein
MLRAPAEPAPGLNWGSVSKHTQPRSLFHLRAEGRGSRGMHGVLDEETFL